MTLQQIGVTQEKYNLPVYKYENVCFVRICDMPETIRGKVQKWMIGQTSILLEGIPMDEQDAVYLWDWERWCEIQRGKPDVWD